MKRCTLIIPDAGPFNSLWVADELRLLLALDMRIVVVDAVFDEMTRDPAGWPKDRDVKAFIEAHQPPFVIEATSTGQDERDRCRRGVAPRRNVGEVAIADFMSSPDGLARYIANSEPVAVLFEDMDLPMVRFFRKPPNLHLLSTVGLLRGLEKAGVIASAQAVIHAMTHPPSADRRARVFNDLPDGTDEPAAIGSSWVPARMSR